MEGSSINQPHVDESPEGIEDFFGDGDAPVEEPAAPTPAANAGEDFDADPPHDPAAEPEAPVEAAPPEPEPEPAPEVEDAPVAQAQPPAPTPGPEPEPQPEPTEAKKTDPRPYLVFQEVKLTGPVLKALMDENQSSTEPSPRVAYFVLATEESRTATGALETAYTANKDSLGDEAVLVPLTEKSWRPKRIKPKVTSKMSLDIS